MTDPLPPYPKKYDPDVAAKMRVWQRAYLAQPEVRERNKERDRAYRARPEVKARKKEQNRAYYKKRTQKDMKYKHKTKPFKHQAAEFKLSRDMKTRALFWEMGTGKSKTAIDTAAWLYQTGKIDCLFVLAPKGVAPNWVYDELPIHLPDAVMKESRIFLWETQKANNKGYQRLLTPLLKHKGLLIVVMSYSGIMTQRTAKAARGTLKGKEFARKLLTQRKCLYVLDESARIKDPSTKRTKRVLASSVYADYRRIMTGTPVSNSPFDVFAQIKFLDPEIWNSIGCRTFAAFKARYGIWVEHIRNDTGRAFSQLVAFQNLDDLHTVVDNIGSRLLKVDVLDLPPKLYSKRYFDMTTEQTTLYQKLRDDFMVYLDSGDMISAPLVITRMLRLQQITSGYCPTDDGNMVLLGTNPRITLLEDTIEECPHQVIIWAKFRQDIKQIMALMQDMKISAVQYDGSTSPVAREDARNSFQAGVIKVFVGNPAAAGEGLTLHAARTVIRYNVGFKLAETLQAEDRAHRIGQEHPVNYIDFIATGTIDAHIVRALREKQDIAQIVTGDRAREWI